MAGRRNDWKSVYRSIEREKSLAGQLKLCRKARRLMQRRTLELAASGGSPDEESAIDEALRELWVLEEKLRKMIN
jgi:hypothetical protein